MEELVRYAAACLLVAVGKLLVHRVVSSALDRACPRGAVRHWRVGRWTVTLTLRRTRP